MNREVHDNRIAGMDGTALKRKIRARGGFTLAETLLAVLIMLLVSVIVATGMPAVTNAYNKVVLGANAKVMLSTAITALHDEIGTAWQVNRAPDKKSITYFNADKGAQSTISLESGKAIQIQDYLPSDSQLIYGESAKKGTAYHLVADKSSEMYVTFETIDYADGIVTISGLKVCKKIDDTPLVKYAGADGSDKSFTIRVITKDVAATGT